MIHEQLPEGYREQPADVVSPGSAPFLEKLHAAPLDYMDDTWVGLCSLLPEAKGVYLGGSELTHEDILAIGIWLKLHQECNK